MCLVVKIYCFICVFLYAVYIVLYHVLLRFIRLYVCWHVPTDVAMRACCLVL